MLKTKPFGFLQTLLNAVPLAAFHRLNQPRNPIIQAAHPRDQATDTAILESNSSNDFNHKLRHLARLRAGLW